MRAALAASTVLWTALLVWELPLTAGHVDLYADWDHQLVEAEVGARAVRQGEAPFWNPYPCGGLPSLAKPLSRFGTPFFLLHLVAEPATALRWEIVAHLLIAAFGTALLVRRHAAGDALTRAAAALLGGMIYSGSSFFALHLTEGHLWILTAAYLPWVLYCFERGIESAGFAALCGALLALMLGEGGALPLPLAALLLCVYAATLAVRDRSHRPLTALTLAGGVGVLLSAPKLLPMLEFLRRHPRETLDQMAFPLQAVVHGLFDRSQALRRSYDWLYWGWQEQGHYVGVAVVLLAVVGVARGKRIARVYTGLALAFLLLAMGPFHELAPWHLLHRVPLFDALHVTSRFLVVCVLLVAVLAGLGLAGLLCRLESAQARAVFATMLVLGVGADLLMARHGIFGVLSRPQCPLRAWPADAPRGDPIVTLRNAPLDSRRCAEPGAFVRSALVPAARAGVAVVHAYNALCPREVRTDVVKPAAVLHRARVPEGLERIRVPRNFGRKPGLSGADEPDYRGEAWLEEGPGSVRLLARSHTTQSLAVEVKGPARVVLNQNWDPGWRASRGRVVEDTAGRLVIELDAPATERLELRYRPPYWETGLLLSGMGFTCLVLAFVWDRRSPGDHGSGTRGPLAPPGARG